MALAAFCKSYAKSNCNTCYGRGFYVVVLPKKERRSCACAQRRYVATRDFVLAENRKLEAVK